MGAGFPPEPAQFFQGRYVRGTPMLFIVIVVLAFFSGIYIGSRFFAGRDVE